MRQDTAPQETLSDIAEPPEETSSRRGRRVFRYAGSDDERRTRAISADELRNGDLIVAPAEYGGCDQWGWAPLSTETVVDLAEEAAMPYAARRFAVRVTQELIQQWHATEDDWLGSTPGYAQTLAQHSGEVRDPCRPIFCGSLCRPIGFSPAFPATRAPSILPISF